MIARVAAMVALLGVILGVLSAAIDQAVLSSDCQRVYILWLAGACLILWGGDCIKEDIREDLARQQRWINRCRILSHTRH
jgi:uncharacterized membrane protein YjfL (UPF0719 family)